MVHFPRPANPRSPANRSYEDSRPASERLREDLHSKYHRNTIQRDLLDQGLYVASDTGKPVWPYHDTSSNRHWLDKDMPQPSADLHQLRADLVDHGFCIVKDALSAEQLHVMRTRLDDQLHGEQAAGLIKAQFPETVFMSALCNKGQCFRDCVELNLRGVQRGPEVEQLVNEILGQGWLLNSLAAGIAGKDGIPQALHCGQSMVPKPWPPWPFECFVGFLLDDFSPANGGTLLVPGSHKITSETGEDKLPELPPAYNVVAPAGSVLLFDGRMVHGTGVNTTDRPRRLIIMTVHKAFMRTQDTYSLTLEKEVYADASPKLLQRLGFTVDTNVRVAGHIPSARPLAPSYSRPPLLLLLCRWVSTDTRASSRLARWHPKRLERAARAAERRVLR